MNSGIVIKRAHYLQGQIQHVETTSFNVCTSHKGFAMHQGLIGGRGLVSHGYIYITIYSHSYIFEQIKPWTEIDLKIALPSKTFWFVSCEPN